MAAGEYFMTISANLLQCRVADQFRSSIDISHALN